MESKQIRELLKSEVVREKIRVDAKYAWHWDCFLCLKGWGYAGVKRIGGILLSFHQGFLQT